MQAGTAMVERGVSKRVAVRVEDVRSDGSISATALGNAREEPEPTTARPALVEVVAQNGTGIE